MTNCNLSEIVANLAEILPSSQAAGTVLTSAFKLDKCRKALATVQVGTPGSGGIVNAQFMWCATSGGTYAAVTGAQMTAMSGAGIQQIEMRADRVNALGQGPYFKLQLVVTVATTPTAAIVQGSDCRYEPANQFNDAAILTAAVYV